MYTAVAKTKKQHTNSSAANAVAQGLWHNRLKNGTFSNQHSPPIQRVKMFNIAGTSNLKLSKSEMDPDMQNVVCGIRMSYTDNTNSNNIDKEYIGKTLAHGGLHAEDKAIEVITHWINQKKNAGVLINGQTITAKLYVNKSMCSTDANAGETPTFTPTVIKPHSCTHRLVNLAGTAINGVTVNLELRVMRIYKGTGNAVSRRAIRKLKRTPGIVLKPWKLKKRHSTLSANKLRYIQNTYGGTAKIKRIATKKHRLEIEKI